MGAKAHQQQRLRRGGFKCEFCGRELKSLESLRTHENVLHSVAVREKEKRKTIKPRRAQVDLARKSNSVTIVPAKSKVPIVVVENPANMPETMKAVVLKESTSKPKVEFKCSKCEKSFLSNFSLLRHTKKSDCNSISERNSTEDPVMSILKDFCPDDGITETVDMSDVSGSIYCVGCKQTFLTMKMFDLHVPSLHCEGVESMFFPTKEEYKNWRTEMESFTKVSYNLMDNYNTKQVYRCSHPFVLEPNNPNQSTVKYCPSTVISQDFPKGIQVHYYKQHCGHTFRPYILPDKYKQYSITGLLQQASAYNSIPQVKDEEDDLYIQFKTLMESIIMDAAKINIATLRVLIGKALDMTSVLTTYDEDDDGTFETKVTLSTTNTDAELNTALNNIKKRQRTKSDVQVIVQPPPKIFKPSVTKNQKANFGNSFSLADERDTDKILKELDGEKSGTRPQKKLDVANEPPIESPKILTKLLTEQSPSSFNDSYKSFVDKNFVSRSAPKKNEEKKKQIVKTKIGQFKPSLSPKNVSPKTTMKTYAVSDRKSVVSPVTSKKPVISPVSSKDPVMSLVSSKKILSPVSSKNTVISPVSAKKTLMTPVSAKKTVITPVSAKKTVVTPVSAKKTVVTPVSAKKTVIAPVSGKKTVITPVSAKKTVITPVSAKKAGSPVTVKSKSVKTAAVVARATRNSLRNDRNSFAKVKEIAYEVKERENDCNILILKI